MGLISNLFVLKKGKQYLAELQAKGEEVYYQQTVVENEILNREKPEVRKWLKSEFDFQYAMNRIADNMADRYGVHMPLNLGNTEDMIKRARFMAKLTEKSTSTQERRQEDES